MRLLRILCAWFRRTSIEELLVYSYALFILQHRSMARRTGKIRSWTSEDYIMAIMLVRENLPASFFRIFCMARQSGEMSGHRSIKADIFFTPPMAEIAGMSKVATPVIISMPFRSERAKPGRLWETAE